MLIAIMTSTFEANNEVRELVQMKVKLRFIIDNWWFDAIGEQKHRIKYIIAAMNLEKNNELGEELKTLNTTFNSLKSEVTDTISKI